MEILGKESILNDKNEISRGICFFEILCRILSMIEMKREKPSEVEGFSLKRLNYYECVALYVVIYRLIILTL